MNRRTSIAYIDVLSAIVAFFIMVTGLLMAANHELSKGNIVKKAEFVVILEWPENSKSDVDLWVRNPFGNVVSYKHKDVGLINLDRDDTGTANNSVIGPNGTTIYSTVRREIATIRGIMPGQHVVDVMLYALREQPPIIAKVQIIKLNPYSVVVEREVSLSETGEEKTIASFDVLPDGAVTNVNTITEISLSKSVN